MIAVVAAIVGITLIWLTAGRDIATSELLIKLSSTAAIILIFPLAYVWKIFTIPEKSAQIVLGARQSYTMVKLSGMNRARIVRVMLKNNTCNEISRGKLNLLNLNPPNGAYKDFLLDGRIAIEPHKTIFIDVASYNEGTSEAPIGLWIQLAIPRHFAYLPVTFNRLPIRSHTFCLRFSSLDDNIFDAAYCRIFVDSDHILHLEEWS